MSKEADKSLKDEPVLLPLLNYLRPFWIPILFSLILLIFAKIIEASLPAFMGHLSELLFKDSFEITVRQETFYKIAKGALLLALVLLIGFLAEAFSTYLRSVYAERGLFRLRKDVYHHILLLPLQVFDKSKLGSLITRTIHDVDQVNQLFSESFVPILSNLVIFLVIFAAISYLSVYLAFGILVLLPFVFFLTNNFRLNQKKIYDYIRTLVSDLNAFTQEHLAGVTVIKSFGLIERENKEFVILNQNLKNGYLRAINNFSFFIAGIDFMTSSFYILAFVLIAFTSKNGFNASLYFTMSLYAAMVFRPLADLAERYNSLEASFAGGRRVFQILKENREDLHSGIDLKETIETIEFKDVYFAYNEENWVLQGVSFRVKKGEKIAFVGETGAGKSTIFTLLLRFYDYQKGSILINGIELKNISKESIRKHTSVVLQDPVVFSGSLKDNITLFEENPDSKQLEEAFKSSRLENVFGPIDLNETLTKSKSLSTGETQLFAFARALYNNREILLFDEATAHIDPKTEEDLENAIQKTIEGKTAITIAHRLSTVKQADLIYVMKNGSIIEEGSHDSLIRLKGVYEKLYRLQFS